jgi:predicted ATPase
VARKLAGNTTARMIVGMLRNCVVYQFHDTSEKAGIRTFWSKSDNRFLKENGANLAPVLLRLKENRRENYNRIIEIISQLLPHFADFFLEPDDNSLLLRWKEIGTDTIFDSHQASDGSLRIMALITLLLRPQNEIPDLLILDEPELGLHPKAIHVIAGLIKSVSVNKQVVLATQSKELVDQFEPEDVITLERKSRGTVLKRLNSEALGEWLQEYSLGDLWEKNVIGGRP